MVGEAGPEGAAPAGAGEVAGGHAVSWQSAGSSRDATGPEATKPALRLAHVLSLPIATFVKCHPFQPCECPKLSKNPPNSAPPSAFSVRCKSSLNGRISQGDEHAGREQRPS